ncbi:2457_t:CDS:1, partial [Entrophospora sp. SA101]
TTYKKRYLNTNDEQITLNSSIFEIKQKVIARINNNSDLNYIIPRQNITMLNDDFNITENNFINQYIIDKEIRDKLTELEIQFFYEMDFTFYTDGSMKINDDTSVNMGIGWIRRLNNEITHSFNAGMGNWPSSNKAETISILTTLLVVPSNSNVIIYTDSKTSI